MLVIKSRTWLLSTIGTARSKQIMPTTLGQITSCQSQDLFLTASNYLNLKAF